MSIKDDRTADSPGIQRFDSRCYENEKGPFMPGGMAFRKDCEECGRSFLTQDKKAKICQRCAGKGNSRPRPETVTPKGTSAKAVEETKKSLEKSPTSGSVEGPTIRVAKEIAAKGGGSPGTKDKAQQAPQEIKNASLGEATPTSDRKQEEVELTPAQVQAIVDRYRQYVEGLERPPIGRRKTIAADMGLPYQSVVLALRQWNQQLAFQVENLVREERFAIEKIYFSLLEEQISFLEIKARIVQATGLDLWAVSRYLDLLHDGERKVRNVPPVSLEQETTILEEYRNYLSGSGPPEPPLHALIAERTGVLPKQVYKVLLAYRLSRFHEKWS